MADDDLPECVTPELITKIWREYLNDEELQISNCKITRVGEKGDNYSSIMTRAVSLVSSKDKKEEKSMVIKTYPKGELIAQYVKESRSFEKEIKMLQEVLPELEKILENIGASKQLGAKVYYSQTEPYYLLAMEDLGVEKFSVAERSVGLCLEECLTVVRSLAMFHAASMVYLQRNDIEKDFFETWIMGAEQADKLTPGLKSSLTTTVENFDKCSMDKWSKKLLSLLDTKHPELFYKCIDTKNPNRPMVLNHGDLWLNNIMFRHLCPKSPELRFVDLQLSWINSPIFDLMYFLFTSPRIYVRLNHMDSILKAYHADFIETTNKLNLNVKYSYEDLRQDLKDNIPFAFGIFHFVFAVTVAPKQHALEDPDSEGADIMKGNPIFSNKYFQNSFLSALPFFEEMGFL